MMMSQWKKKKNVYATWPPQWAAFLTVMVIIDSENHPLEPFRKVWQAYWVKIPGQDFRMTSSGLGSDGLKWLMQERVFWAELPAIVPTMHTMRNIVTWCGSLDAVIGSQGRWISVGNTWWVIQLKIRINKINPNRLEYTLSWNDQFAKQPIHTTLKQSDPFPRQQLRPSSRQQTYIYQKVFKVTQMQFFKMKRPKPHT